MAYGHYAGIRKYAGTRSIGIVNFDAHFDLRDYSGEASSGTPFRQIASECEQAGLPFHYLCLGVEPLSNISSLFDTADRLGVSYVRREDFTLSHKVAILQKVSSFLDKVDLLYLTIDLDGFSAAIAPGVSAPSPFGFEVTLVLQILDLLVASGKMVSMDVAELNPEYDRDGQTAKLAAYLIAYVYQHADLRITR